MPTGFVGQCSVAVLALLLYPGAILALLITGYATSAITVPPLYSAAFLPSPSFTYNFTSATARFSLAMGPYRETRHYTNTSTLTGLPDPTSSSYSFHTLLSSPCTYVGYSLIRAVGLGPQYSRQPTGDTVQLPVPGCSAQQAVLGPFIVALPLCALSSVLAFTFSRSLATLVEDHRAGVLPGWAAHVDVAAVRKKAQAHVLVLVLIGLASADLLALLASLLAWTRADEFRGGEWNAGLIIFFTGVAYSLVALWGLVAFIRYQFSQLRDVPPVQAPGNSALGDSGLLASAAEASALDAPALGEVFSPSSSSASSHALTLTDRTSSTSHLAVEDSARGVARGMAPHTQSGVHPRAVHESFPSTASQRATHDSFPSPRDGTHEHTELQIHS